MSCGRRAQQVLQCSEKADCNRDNGSPRDSCFWVKCWSERFLEPLNVFKGLEDTTPRFFKMHCRQCVYSAPAHRKPPHVTHAKRVRVTLQAML